MVVYHPCLRFCQQLERDFLKLNLLGGSQTARSLILGARPPSELIPSMAAVGITHIGGMKTQKSRAPDAGQPCCSDLCGGVKLINIRARHAAIWIHEATLLCGGFWKKSRSAPTRALAKTPTLYHVSVIPDRPFLVIPKVSSEKREYLPIGWLELPVVPSSNVRVLLDANLWHFGILTSSMHTAWLRHLGGRLKSDYRYSIRFVYNTFPWPDADPKQRHRIEKLVQAVLDARGQFPDATLAALCDHTVSFP